MAIEQFFNLQKKKVNDDLEIILDKIANTYSIRVKTYKIEEKNMVISKVRYFKPIKALQKLCLYEEQYQNRDSE